MNEEPISAHVDPQGQTPWALQVVVCVPKVDPPTHLQTLRAVCAAVVTSLAQFDHGTPEQQAAMARWRDGRIRKVVRRARGAAWERSDLLGSISTTSEDVTVRVYAPGPIDQVPHQISRLQVGGFNLPDTPRAPTGAPTPGAPVTLYLTPEVELSTGKAAAQVAHGAQLVYEQLTDAQRAHWSRTGFACEIRPTCPTLWAQVREAGQVHITDAGFTEIPAGTMTVVANHRL